jgi:hypothetical protein
MMRSIPTETTFQHFLDKYGTSTTTNFQLIKWASDDLKISPFYYCMKDEIKNLNRIKKLPIYCIINYHTTEQPGVHHVAMYTDKDKRYYFDSYGYPPLLDAKTFLKTENKTFIASTFKIQPDYSKICGQISLYVLYKLSRGEDFFDIILSLEAQHFLTLKKDVERSSSFSLKNDIQ